MIAVSAQASGGRHLAPADPLYPFRCVVLEERANDRPGMIGGWRRLAVFECQSEQEANDTAMDMCTEPYEDGVIHMHFYVGEVARG